MTRPLLNKDHSRRLPRPLAFGPLLSLPILVLCAVPGSWPAWALMWVVALTIYVSCKWLTWSLAPTRPSSVARHLAYLLAWPGLDATTFLSARRPRIVTTVEWLHATLKTVSGMAMLWGLARVIPSENKYLVGWVGMIGIVMILHFGLFHLLSCVWRAVLIDARPIMDRPLLATSLTDFWGRRWNLAFRDLVHRYMFRPLIPLLAPHHAVLVVFLFSGLVHELVVSVPARGGYGGPSIYFLVQGVGLVVERRMTVHLCLERPWLGRAFTLLLVLGPISLLFHVPFVTRVVIPFMHTIGAI